MKTTTKATHSGHGRQRGQAHALRGAIGLYDPFERIFAVPRALAGEPFDGFAARAPRRPHF